MYFADPNIEVPFQLHNRKLSSTILFEKIWRGGYSAILLGLYSEVENGLKKICFLLLKCPSELVLGF